MRLSRACGIPLLLASTLSACGAGTPPPEAVADAPAEAKAIGALAETPEASKVEPKAGGPAPELRAAGEGPVAELVVAELARAAAERRRLIVYVGASWCEPCVAFHEAVAAGRVGAPLGGARFLEFDMDHDAARLREAGYTSRMIPLFVVPEADGRAGPRRVEGGIKGPGAVDNLVARLAAILGDAG